MLRQTINRVTLLNTGNKELLYRPITLPKSKASQSSLGKFQDFLTIEPNTILQYFSRQLQHEIWRRVILSSHHDP